MKPSAVLIVRTGEDRAACVLIIKKERTMRKKLLFLVSVFVVALLRSRWRKVPRKRPSLRPRLRPNAALKIAIIAEATARTAPVATSAGKTGAPIARRAPMRNTAEANVRRTPNAIAGLRAIAGLPVIAAAEGRPAERTMP